MANAGQPAQICQLNVLAAYKLGVMYNNGEGVPQDFREAVNWFYRAASLGYAPAQSSLGIKFEKGQGVKRDYGDPWRSTTALPPIADVRLQ